MSQLAEDWQERGIELKEVSSGFRFQVRKEYSGWLGCLWSERPPRYTRATTSPQPEPVAARDGKVYVGRRKESTAARRATLREFRAQCR